MTRGSVYKRGFESRPPRPAKSLSFSQDSLIAPWDVRGTSAAELADVAERLILAVADGDERAHQIGDELAHAVQAAIAHWDDAAERVLAVDVHAINHALRLAAMVMRASRGAETRKVGGP